MVGALLPNCIATLQHIIFCTVSVCGPCHQCLTTKDRASSDLSIGPRGLISVSRPWTFKVSFQVQSLEVKGTVQPIHEYALVCPSMPDDRGASGGATPGARSDSTREALTLFRRRDNEKTRRIALLFLPQNTTRVCFSRLLLYHGSCSEFSHKPRSRYLAVRLQHSGMRDPRDDLHFASKLCQCCQKCPTSHCDGIRLNC